MDMLPGHSKRVCPRRNPHLQLITWSNRTTSQISFPILDTVSHFREAVVGDSQQGLRLDRALGELFTDYSRNFLANLVTEGHVSIDDRPAAKPSRRVETGQRLKIEVPPASPSSLPSQDIPFAVLYEDSDVVVIDKPAGLVVHPAAGHPDQTLVNALLFHVKDLSGIGGEIRPGIVHRLDKDTSGAMVIAKHDDAHRKLKAAWNSERVQKEYLALVYGTPAILQGVVDAPIARDPRDRKRMAIVAGGREAITEYRVMEQLRYGSLVRCRLRTGRTHQIRVHMKHLGHPIVGDPLYSGPQWRGIGEKRVQKVLSSLQRQMLHATRIAFDHPRTGERLSFEAPVPADFAAVLVAMR